MSTLLLAVIFYKEVPTQNAHFTDSTVSDGQDFFHLLTCVIVVGWGAGWGFHFHETGFLGIAQTASKLKDLQPSTAETTGIYNHGWCVLHYLFHFTFFEMASFSGVLSIVNTHMACWTDKQALD